MSNPQLEDRRRKLHEVLTIVQSLPEFDREDVLSQCSESKGPFVTNVLKQLSADNVLGIVKPSEANASLRYAWIIDRLAFDGDVWIHRQLTAGHPVSLAPKEERPRERLLQRGAQSLTNGELLAILIRSGLKGESAVQSGLRVASHFEKQLERLPGHSSAELKHISKAVSQVAYCQIMAGIELGRRVTEAAYANPPAVKINSTRAAIEYCAKHFARLAQDARQEEFHIVTLDTKLQPIRSHQITVGTLDASLVHPREVFRAAIRDAASSVLLVHNHPSGDPTPSRQDHEVTERLKRSGEVLGISVIDHIIVARQETVSLAEWH